jgi:hypothetical protein
MIKIVLLLFLFLLYVSVQREGLRNYLPIYENNRIYGVNVNYGDPNNIYNKLKNPNDPLYDKKFETFSKQDVFLDMQYFNNASYLLFKL